MPEVPALARRIETMLEFFPPPNGARSWSHTALAELISAHGFPVGRDYVGKLRNGTRHNPDQQLLHALERAFGLRTNYFLDDAIRQENNDLLACLRAMRTTSDKLVSRTGCLSAADARMLHQLSHFAEYVESSGHQHVSTAGANAERSAGHTYAPH